MVNQLKELVSKGIEGIPSTNKVGTIYKCTLGKWRVCIHTKQGAEHVYSVPDLINDDDFMKSVYGEEPECTECGIRKCLFEDEEQQCPWTLPRYKLIQQQAITLSGDAQVRYLHKMMMEVGNGM